VPPPHGIHDIRDEGGPEVGGEKGRLEIVESGLVDLAGADHRSQCVGEPLSGPCQTPEQALDRVEGHRFTESA